MERCFVLQNHFSATLCGEGWLDIQGGPFERDHPPRKVIVSVALERQKVVLLLCCKKRETISNVTDMIDYVPPFCSVTKAVEEGYGEEGGKTKSDRVGSAVEMHAQL